MNNTYVLTFLKGNKIQQLIVNKSNSSRDVHLNLENVDVDSGFGSCPDEFM